MIRGYFLLLTITLRGVSSFLAPNSYHISNISPKIRNHRHHHAPSFLSAATNEDATIEEGIADDGAADMTPTTTSSSTTTIATVFDFTKSPVRALALPCFERIDDAIMGGVSSSRLRDGVVGSSLDNDKEGYATWSGTCRTTGGGFCGVRTKPLAEPVMIPGEVLLVNTTDDEGIFDKDGEKSDAGVYLECLHTGDNEPQRRVWKTTLRTDSSRGQMGVYQADFNMPLRPVDNSWSKVYVPFHDFKLVSGPSVVRDGGMVDVSGGVYQFGLIMSKFRVPKDSGAAAARGGGGGEMFEEVDDFRDGPFELRIKRWGFYGRSDLGTSDVNANPVIDTNTDNTDTIVASPASSPTSTTSTNDSDSNTLRMISIEIPTTLASLEDKKKSGNTVETSSFSSSSVTTSTPTTSTNRNVVSSPSMKKILLLPFRLVLLPIVKFLFLNEGANRRKASALILKEKRDLSGFSALRFMVNLRRGKRQFGLARSIILVTWFITVDTIRRIARISALTLFRVCFAYPKKLVKQIGKVLLGRGNEGGKDKGTREGDDGVGKDDAPILQSS